MSAETGNDFDQFVQKSFPYPVAITYSKMLQAKDAQYRILFAIRAFEYTIRYLGFAVISDYLHSDTAYKPLDEYLGEFAHPFTLENWIGLLYTGIEAFKDNQARMFMPELYEVFSTWASKEHMSDLFNKIIIKRNFFAHQLTTTAEHKWEDEENLIVPVIKEGLAALSFVSHYKLIQFWNGVEKPETEFPNFRLSRDSYKDLPLDPFVISGIHLGDEIGDAGIGLYNYSSVAGSRYTYISAKKEKIIVKSSNDSIIKILSERSESFTAHLSKPQIFISYSRKDWEEYIAPLVNLLKREGFNIWLDQAVLQGGQDWLDEINTGLQTCKCLVLCVSPDALDSKWVKMEYRYFIEENKLIIPVLCRQTNLPAELRGIQNLPYHSLDALVNMLKELPV